MQLMLKKNGYKIVFSSKGDLETESLAKVFEIFNNTIDSLSGDTSEEIVQKKQYEMQHVEISDIGKAAPVQQAVAQERPAFRDRLPNNVVNINELTIQQAVKENALVRCPECGQAHAIIVHSAGKMYMMRKDYDKNEFIVIADWDESDTKAMLDACCKEDTDKKLFFEDLQQLTEDESLGDFIVDTETEIFCPVCTKSNAFWTWKDAFEHPLNYFETEELCDACGGETVGKLTKGKHTTRCEKCCLEQEVRHE